MKTRKQVVIEICLSCDKYIEILMCSWMVLLQTVLLDFMGKASFGVTNGCYNNTWPFMVSPAHHSSLRLLLNNLDSKTWSTTQPIRARQQKRSFVKAHRLRLPRNYQAVNYLQIPREAIYLVEQSTWPELQPSGVVGSEPGGTVTNDRHSQNRAGRAQPAGDTTPTSASPVPVAELKFRTILGPDGDRTNRVREVLQMPTSEITMSQSPLDTP
ncbi:hypothetical protein J6590_032786 [Homalodisca vitripennis]|nr:hypothetical protein J6590_032786 [Homalodisca vitripennis]